MYKTVTEISKNYSVYIKLSDFIIPLAWIIDPVSATTMIDPTADERQKARDALGNINVQDANQLAELIGHLYLKMSEHPTSAMAHINTHADDIRYESLLQ